MKTAYSVFGQVDRIFGRIISAETGRIFGRIFGIRSYTKFGARLPVLDLMETIDIVKKYLATAKFTVFHQWNRSSRRVWLGLNFDRSSGLHWADGQSIVSYPASSSLFVWETRRILSAEAPRAVSGYNYGFYIDGDIAKLPGGGKFNLILN